MAWQNTFTAIFGPGLFAGIPAGDWLRVLRDNRFAVHPRFVLRFLSITSASPVNSLYRGIESWRFRGRFMQETIPPPLFVLGHWRSGTTHLHNLLSRDDRFAFPSLYEVLYPHTFLTTQAITSRLLSFLVPRTRFGIDNVQIGWDVPYEDEFAIAVMSGVSPYMTMAFPRRQQHYDRFLTLADATAQEIEQWKAALTTFLKKLTWKYSRPLILKSPTLTCRIRLLLEMFPDAKFVHIRRNPFEVYPSMKKMLAATRRFWGLQSADCVDWDDRIVRQHREMYDAYFQQRHMIPDGRLYELSFEELEADPVEQVRAIYEALDLSDFEPFEPNLRRYVDSLSGYKKNRLDEPPPPTRQMLTREWSRCFEEWGYATACEQPRAIAHPDS